MPAFCVANSWTETTFHHVMGLVRQGQSSLVPACDVVLLFAAGG